MKTKVELENADSEHNSNEFNLMTVESYWVGNGKVTLTIGESKITVNATSLKKAVENCTNK